MSPLLQLLADHALVLLAGSTTLLALGCGGMAGLRSPAHRQRLGELTVAGVLIWLVLALVPLPRVWPRPGAEREPHSASDESERRPDVPDVPWPDMQRSEWPPVEGRERHAKRAPNVDEPGLPSGSPPVTMAGQSFPPRPSGANDIDGAAEPTSAPAPATNARFRLPVAIDRAAGAAYVAGAFVFAGWLAAGHLLLFRIRRTAKPADAWLVDLARLPDGGSLPARVLTSGTCRRPISFGVFQPAVVLPESLCRREKSAQLRMLLLHELAHVVRRDAWGNAVLNLALPVLYVHPLYWWLKGQVRMAAELIADDWAAALTGKEAYATELVALARSSGRLPLPIAGAAGLFTSSSQFYRRMQMLLAREKPLATSPAAKWRWSVVSIVGLAVGLVAATAGLEPASGRPSDEADLAAGSAEATADDSDAATNADAPQSGKRVPVLADLPLLGRLFAAGDSEGEQSSESTTESGVEPSPAAREPATNQRESLSQRVIREWETRNRSDEVKSATEELRHVVDLLKSAQRQLLLVRGAEKDKMLKRVEGLKLRKAALARKLDALDGQFEDVSADADVNRLAQSGSADRPVRGESLSRWIIRRQEIKLTTEQLEHTIFQLDALESAMRSLSSEADRQDLVQKVRQLEAERDSLAKKLDKLDEAQREVELLARELEAREAADQRNAERHRQRDPANRGLKEQQAISDQKALAGALDGRSIRQSELVALAVAYADALATVDEMQEKLRGYANAEKKSPGAVSGKDVNQARAALKGAERKAKLLERIATAALVSAEADVERLTKLYESARASQSEVLDAQGRLDILREILKHEDEKP